MRSEGFLEMGSPAKTIHDLRQQRLRLLYALVEAALRPEPHVRTHFATTIVGDSYRIAHAELNPPLGSLEALRSDIDAMVASGYLGHVRDDTDRGVLQILFPGFDVFDARIGDQARPEFERRVVSDVIGEGEQGSLEETFAIHGHVYTLVTHQTATDEWMARVSRYSLTEAAERFQTPVIDGRSQLHDQAAIVSQVRETRPTARGALDSLQARLTTAVTDAILGKPDQ